MSIFPAEPTQKWRFLGQPLRGSPVKGPGSVARPRNRPIIPEASRLTGAFYRRTVAMRNLSTPPRYSRTGNAWDASAAKMKNSAALYPLAGYAASPAELQTGPLLGFYYARDCRGLGDKVRIGLVRQDQRLHSLMKT